MKEEFLKKLSKLQTWTHSPTTVEDLRAILREFLDEEIGIAAQVYSVGSAAGRIAWVEYARRRKYLDFDFHATSLKERGLLSVTARALPVHEQPILTLDKKDD